MNFKLTAADTNVRRSMVEEIFMIDCFGVCCLFVVVSCWICSPFPEYVFLWKVWYKSEIFCSSTRVQTFRLASDSHFVRYVE